MDERPSLSIHHARHAPLFRVITGDAGPLSRLDGQGVRAEFVLPERPRAANRNLDAHQVGG